MRNFSDVGDNGSGVGCTTLKTLNFDLIKPVQFFSRMHICAKCLVKLLVVLVDFADVKQKSQ